MSKPDKRLLTRYVFRKKKGDKHKPIYIILLEAILMLITSLVSLLYLNQLPQQFDFEKLFADAISNLLESITLLISSLSIFGSILLVTLLVVLSLLLLVGSISRSFRIISLFLSRKKMKSRIPKARRG